MIVGFTPFKGEKLSTLYQEGYYFVPKSANLSLEGMMILAVLLQDDPKDRIDNFDNLPYIVGPILASGRVKPMVSLIQRIEEMKTSQEGPPTDNVMAMNIKGVGDFVY